MTPSETETVSAPAPPPLALVLFHAPADAAFAAEIAAGLAFAGAAQTQLDDGEDGAVARARAGARIAEADALVVILAPDADPTALEWRLQQARRKAKRLIAIQRRPIGAAEPPSDLARLEPIGFEDGASFVEGLTRLAAAALADRDWVRAHTLLAARADAWRDAGRPEDRLLAGAALSEAQGWIAARPRGAPEPTETHYAYLRASAEAETAAIARERARADAVEATAAEIEKRAEAETQAQTRQAAVWRARARWRAGGLVAAAALAIGAGAAATYALFEKREADQRRLAAIRAAAEAETARSRAVRILAAVAYRPIKAQLRQPPDALPAIVERLIEHTLGRPPRRIGADPSEARSGRLGGLAAGRGYALGEATPAEFEADWGAYLPPEAMATLRPGVGAGQAAAAQAIARLAPDATPETISAAVFATASLPNLLAALEARLPAIARAPGPCYAALALLQVERARFGAAAGFLERPELSGWLGRGDFDGLAAALRETARTQARSQPEAQLLVDAAALCAKGDGPDAVAAAER